MKSALTKKEIYEAAEMLKCEAETLEAVILTESRTSGFLPDDKPKILYEPYIFGRLTKGKFNGITVLVNNTRFPLSLTGSWDKSKAKYGSENIQYIKLREAVRLDREAAYKSCSWGKFQILGLNYLLCGYGSLEEFVFAMYESETEHLKAFINFILNNKLEGYLRQKKWRIFAEKYNGRAQRLNNYAQKLETYYERLKSGKNK